MEITEKTNPKEVAKKTMEMIKTIPSMHLEYAEGKADDTNTTDILYWMNFINRKPTNLDEEYIMMTEFLPGSFTENISIYYGIKQIQYHKQMDDLGEPLGDILEFDNTNSYTRGTVNRIKDTFKKLEKDDIARDTVVFSNPGNGDFGFYVKKSFIQKLIEDINKRKEECPNESCAEIEKRCLIEASKDFSDNISPYVHLGLSFDNYMSSFEGKALERKLQEKDLKPHANPGEMQRCTDTFNAAEFPVTVNLDVFIRIMVEEGYVVKFNGIECEKFEDIINILKDPELLFKRKNGDFTFSVTATTKEKESVHELEKK